MDQGVLYLYEKYKFFSFGWGNGNETRSSISRTFSGKEQKVQANTKHSEERFGGNS